MRTDLNPFCSFGAREGHLKAVEITAKIWSTVYHRLHKKTDRKRRKATHRGARVAPINIDQPSERAPGNRRNEAEPTEGEYRDALIATMPLIEQLHKIESETDKHYEVLVVQCPDSSTFVTVRMCFLQVCGRVCGCVCLRVCVCEFL